MILVMDESTFEGKQRIQKESFDSPGYQTNREAEKDSQEMDAKKRNSTAFGDDVVEDVDSFRRRISPESNPNIPKSIADSVRISPEEGEKRIAKSIKQSRESFLEILDSEQGGTRWQALLSLLGKIKLNPELQKDLELITGPYPVLDGPPNTLNRMVLKKEREGYFRMFQDAIKTGKIPDNLWYRILKNHKEQIDKMAAIFQQEMLPQLKKEFLDKIALMIQKGEFPLTMEEVELRLRDLHIQVLDNIVAHFDDMGGDYQSELHLIRLSEDYIRSARLSKEHASDVTMLYEHEIMHALAGRTIVSQGERGSGDDDYRIFAHIRQGVYFHQADSFLVHTKSKPRFKWLNEGLTEMCAKKLNPDKKGWSYKTEQELIKLIQSKGKQKIPNQLFINAYFENLDPTKPSEQQIPAWKILRQSINGAFGQKFLIHLDDRVKKDGIENTLEAMKRGKIW